MSVIALHDDDDDKVVDFSTRQSKAACDPNGKAVTVRLRGYAYSRWRRVCTVASYLFIFTHDAAKKTHTNNRTKPDTLPPSTDRNTTHRPTNSQTLRNRTELLR